MNNGVETRRKKPVWSHGSIQALLKNTHYGGHYDYEDKKSGEAIRVNCPPILEPTLISAVRSAMEKRGYKRVGSRRTHTHNQKHTYLLTELLVCKHCGGKFSGTTKTTQESYYRCRTKNNKFRRDKSPDYAGCTSNRNLELKPTDELVWNAVVSVLENSHVFKERIKCEFLGGKTFHRSTSEMKDLKKRLKKVDAEIEKTGDSIVNLKTELLVGNVDDQDLDKIVTKLEERRTELQKQKDILVTQLDTEQSNRVWVDWLKEFGKRIEQLRNLEMTVAERKRFLQGVVDTVEVKSLDQRGHTLDIKFLFPYVNDALSKNTKGQFAPVDGKHTLRTRGFLSKKTLNNSDVRQ